MKKNENGFTLIELLAVIVILAIIALITTPAILNVVNDSRKKAAVDSTYGVIDAAKLAFTNNQISATPVNADVTLNFAGGAASKSVGDKQVRISGDQPASGTLVINVTTGVISVSKLKFGSFYCSTYSNDTKVCCTTSNTVCTSE